MRIAAPREGHVYAGIIKGYLDVAAAFGADIRAIARQLDIDIPLLALPDALLPTQQYYQLLQLIQQYTGNPDIGLYMGRTSYLEGMHLYLYMASASRSMREWLNMMPSVSNTFGDVGQVRIKSERSRFMLQWHPKVPPRPDRCVVTDSMLSNAVLQMSSFCVLPVRPIRVDLSYPEPADCGPLQEMLGRELRFSQPVSGLYYPREVLDYPLVHVSTRFYDKVAEEFAQVFSDDSTIADPFFLSLHAAIRKQLPRGDCSIELIASDMNMSRRTLQRRLNEHGTNFQQLLQGIKSDLAKKYLADEKLTIIEIAFLLGYGDHSTFSAAFKSWNGMTPSEFRQR